MGFGVPLNFLWPCLLCHGQWLVPSNALNVSDEHDSWFRDACSSNWSPAKKLMLAPNHFSPHLIHLISFFHMFSEPLPLLHLHLLNPRLCSYTWVSVLFPAEWVLQGWEERGEKTADCPSCSCFVLSALWWLGERWLMEMSAGWYPAPNFPATLSLEAQVRQAVKWRPQEGWSYQIQLHPNCKHAEKL